MLWLKYAAMKTRHFILITLLLLLLSVPAMAGRNTLPFTGAAEVGYSGNFTDTIRMDFESIPDFSLTQPPWQDVDLDHHSTYGILNHSYPNDTVSKAFMCFNPASVTPPMTDSAIQPHSGAKFGACFSAIPAPNNDWLISPKIQLGVHGLFSLWVKSYTGIYSGLEEYNVLVSLTDSAPPSFTAISGSQPLRAPLTWTQKMFDLSAYKNQAIYLAVQCVSNDHFIFMVDDMEIITNTSGALKADFTADKTQINSGESVNFQDLSTGFPTTWQWTFTGGTPSTSTAQNPSGITYNSPGNYDVTLIVGNAFTTDTTTLNGYIHVGGYPSSASLDFENLANFTLDFSPWTTWDVKGGATYTMVDNITGQTIVFPHSGQAMAYICFNPAATIPPERYMKPHSGLRLGCCFSSMPLMNPNDKWLISPRLSLGTNSQLDLWVMSYDTTYGIERYNIAVSTTDNNPSSFVYLTQNYETAPATWTHRAYDLKDYNNKTVYVAIQCVSDTDFIFMLDDIHITSLAGIADDQESIRISVYPNPAREYINFSCNMPQGTKIKAQLVNVLGKSLRSMEFESSTGSVKIDIHDLSPGIYSMVIQALGHQAVQKIVIQ